MGILGDTMGELGIHLIAGAFTPWTLPQSSLVAEGVVAPANKIGSFGQLLSLLGIGVLPVFFYRAATPLWIIQNAVAHTLMVQSFWSRSRNSLTPTYSSLD